MIRITGRQCRMARALLKWNIQDIASRSRVRQDRLEEFERASLRLFQPELLELLRLFEKNGIVFKGESEVIQKNKGSGFSGSSSVRGGSAISVERVDVTDDLINYSGDKEDEESEGKRVDAPRIDKRF